MITAWIVSLCALLGILGVLIRLSFQVGLVVQRLNDYITNTDRRLESLERPKPASRTRRA